MKFYPLLFISLVCSFCTKNKKQIEQQLDTTTVVVEEKQTPLFSAVSSEQSGINFNNFNIENQGANYYHYEYF